MARNEPLVEPLVLLYPPQSYRNLMPYRCTLPYKGTHQVVVLLRAAVHHHKIDLVLKLLLDLPHAGSHRLAVLAPWSERANTQGAGKVVVCLSLKKQWWDLQHVSLHAGELSRFRYRCPVGVDRGPATSFQRNYAQLERAVQVISCLAALRR